MLWHSLAAAEADQPTWRKAACRLVLLILQKSSTFYGARRVSCDQNVHSLKVLQNPSAALFRKGVKVFSPAEALLNWIGLGGIEPEKSDIKRVGIAALLIAHNALVFGKGRKNQPLPWYAGILYVIRGFKSFAWISHHES
jgi:hypothetical protein